MKRSYATYSSLAVAVALALGGCSTWQHTSREEKGTAVGATGGALVGAAVGGPVGAAVGAGVGGYAGYHETQPGGLAARNGPLASDHEQGGNGMRYGENSDEIRSVQQALNDQGYNAGPVDGQMGPNTEDALRQLQQAKNLPQTGEPDPRTLAALGISSQASYQASNQANGSSPSYRANESSQQANASSRPSNQASNEYATQSRGMASSAGTATGNNRGSDEIRSVQQALNDKGFNAGAVDGVMGPHTQHALRQFQQKENLRQTGRPDAQTLAALGISNQASNQGSNQASNQGSNQASNQPSNQAMNQAPNESSNQPSSQGMNQAPSEASNQPSNQASNLASTQPSQANESNQANGSNPSNSDQRTSNQ
jgi:peptidoglycan hydrolase-like protein with peptidoglycan-binding domain